MIENIPEVLEFGNVHSREIQGEVAVIEGSKSRTTKAVKNISKLNKATWWQQQQRETNKQQ